MFSSKNIMNYAIVEKDFILVKSRLLSIPIVEGPKRLGLYIIYLFFQIH